MTNKELVQRAKKVMNDLSADNNMLEHEQAAYNCLRLFCERIEQTKNIAAIVNGIKMQADENLSNGQHENDANWGYQDGVLITNRQALDIAKYTPLYID
jgi:hypothetical protein